MKDGVGLGDAYGATLERIKAQGGEKTKLAMATLMWVCHAERPLQVDELRHALAVEIGEADFDGENAPSIGALLGCCQGLITVDKEASTVRVIHFTVQEYLCAHPDLFNHPHSVIAETCLTYLNSPQVKNLSSNPLTDHPVTPFLKYASRYWGTHAKRELSSRAMALGLQLLSQYEGHPSAEALLEQVLSTGYTARTGSSPLFSGLHCASFFGIVELVASLASAPGCEINQGDRVSRTPLLWAAKNGHHGVVRILLGREGVDPEMPDIQDSTPLLWAANNGHEEVVKLLLGRNDVDPNRPDDQHGTPLSWAARDGHEGVVKLLLDRKDVDPNRLGQHDRTPLGCAAVTGHEGVVKLLLGRNDVDPNRPEENGRTPLACAAADGRDGVVKLLLGQTAVDPNRPDAGGLTPLGCAAYWGHKGAAKLLLARDDVDPNYPDKYGKTPFGWAASKGYEGVVDLLLGREDVDLDRPGEDGRTPLECAIANGHEGVVKPFQARVSMEGADAQPSQL